MKPFSVAGMSADELREEMLALLSEIAREGQPTDAARVGAARAVLDNLPTEQPLDTLLRLFRDDPEEALAWARAIIPRLEDLCEQATLAKRRLAPSSNSSG